MYVCIYLCMYVCMYMYMYIYIVCVCVCVYVCMCVCMCCVYVCAFLQLSTITLPKHNSRPKKKGKIDECIHLLQTRWVGSLVEF
jgi:hypothetical protein